MRREAASSLRKQALGKGRGRERERENSRRETREDERERERERERTQGSEKPVFGVVERCGDQ
jgi:hypothetical protein